MSLTRLAVRLKTNFFDHINNVDYKNIIFRPTTIDILLFNIELYTSSMVASHSSNNDLLVLSSLMIQIYIKQTDLYYKNTRMRIVKFNLMNYLHCKLDLR